MGYGYQNPATATFTTGYGRWKERHHRSSTNTSRCSSIGGRRVHNPSIRTTTGRHAVTSAPATQAALVPRHPQLYITIHRQPVNVVANITTAPTGSNSRRQRPTSRSKLCSSSFSLSLALCAPLPLTLPLVPVLVLALHHRIQGRTGHDCDCEVCKCADDFILRVGMVDC